MHYMNTAYAIDFFPHNIRIISKTFLSLNNEEINLHCINL